MKFLIEMNLSPRRCSVLAAAGWESAHWSNVGIPSDPDHDIMQWTPSDSRIILTHDLDYGAVSPFAVAAFFHE